MKDLFKTNPLDVDAVIEALGEIENMKQEFDDKMGEITGTEDQMPWEKVRNNLSKWKYLRIWINGFPANRKIQICRARAILPAVVKPAM